ncbi:MAG: Gfo/Idh/MocA family oxidoreductase, partial [Chlamydiota bacterium]|nr:Gfo/Idh/MocA family oxidoreductase [Chlamydiota bacterium]
MGILKAIVVGVGHLGKEHARIYAQHEDIQLLGVVDINFERAKEIAQIYDTRHYRSLEEVDSDFDIATVAVPTVEHYKITKELLEKGKHVLVEKPITETVEQASALVQLSEQNQLVLQVGHVERYNPAIQALATILDHPRFIECHRLSSFPNRGTDVGVVLDLMIHDIDIILH